MCVTRVAQVERCMRVLDGCVLVVDAVAGVQVQTQQVYRQASRAQRHLNKPSPPASLAHTMHTGAVALPPPHLFHQQNGPQVTL